MAAPSTRRRGSKKQREKWSTALIRPTLWTALFAMAYIVAPISEDVGLETMESADVTEIKRLELAVSSIHSPNQMTPSHVRRELSAHEPLSKDDESLHYHDHAKSSGSQSTKRLHPQTNSYRAISDADRTRHPSINVFYHTFSGPTEENRNLTQRIASEQIAHIGAASNRSQDFQWILRYRSVGDQSAVNPTFLVDKCNAYSNLKCEYQGHETHGHEETTLNQMRNFCVENPEELVVYLHTKGAYHDFDMNKRWRGPLTVSAVHHSCLEALVEGKCNTCGLQFYATWAPMFPGNMFAAKCAYVQHLLPLEEFGAKLKEVVHTTTTEPQLWKHTLYTRHYKENFVDINGLERYANEQWIGSHPSISACDLTDGISVLYPLAIRALKDTSMRRLGDDAEAEEAPQVDLDAGRFFRIHKPVLLEAYEMDGVRPHEYFLLPGILYRFYKVYGSFPSAKSWVWDYFPNGALWKRNVGIAVDRVRKGQDTAINETIIW